MSRPSRCSAQPLADLFFPKLKYKSINQSFFLDQSCLSVGLNHSEIVLEYMDTCFSFLDVSKNCGDGAIECNQRGGFLAEILDESINALLLDRALYLRDIGVNRAWWIGGYDEDVGRSWYWSDSM